MAEALNLEQGKANKEYIHNKFYRQLKLLDVHRAVELLELLHRSWLNINSY